MVLSEPRVGCGAAIIVEGHILLLLRKSGPEAGSWCLPGGKVDLYERAADAAEREVAEELGIDITASDSLCLVDEIDEIKGVHWFGPVYLATAFAGVPTLIEPEKHADVRWFPIGAVPTELTFPTRGHKGVARASGDPSVRCLRRGFVRHIRPVQDAFARASIIT